MIAAGKLNKRITIQSPIESQETTYGSVSLTYSNYATIWASLEPLAGREVLAAKSFSATVSHVVRIRYMAGILPTMRLTYGDRVFQINGILNPLEANTDLNLFCTEVVGVS